MEESLVIDVLIANKLIKKSNLQEKNKNEAAKIECGSSIENNLTDKELCCTDKKSNKDEGDGNQNSNTDKTKRNNKKEKCNGSNIVINLNNENKSFFAKYKNLRGGGDKPMFERDLKGPPLIYTPRRNDFVRIVFFIATCMLLVTIAFSFLVMLNNHIKSFFINMHTPLMILSAIGLVIISYSYMCSECVNQFPCNILMLFVVVASYSGLIGCVIVKYKAHVIIYAFISTCCLCTFCMILAHTTFDFTKYMLYVVAIIFVLAVATIIVLIVTLVLKLKMTVPQFVITILLIVIQAVMLVIELQMILGHREVELEEDDYAYGAYLIYTSFVHLFLKIVRLINLLSYIRTGKGEHADPDTE